jgi:hypothetical protein
VDSLKRAAEKGLLEGTEVWMFTDNTTAKAAFRGSSKSRQLHKLVLRLVGDEVGSPNLGGARVSNDYDGHSRSVSRGYECGSHGRRGHALFRSVKFVRDASVEGQAASVMVRGTTKLMTST